MRRILAHDPQIAAALSKIEADQGSLHSRIAAEKDRPSDKANTSVPSRQPRNNAIDGVTVASVPQEAAAGLATVPSTAA